MSDPANAAIAALFVELEPAAAPACTRQDRIKRLLDLHELAARQHAETAYLALTSAPDFIDASVSNKELGGRLDAAFDALKSAAAEVRERRDAEDDATRILAEGRLVLAFYKRFNELALQGCLARGGSV